jgi:hypothetical protein
MFAEQRIGTLRPNAPVLINSNHFDPLVPWIRANQLGRDWCAQGADVEFRTNEEPPFLNKTSTNHALPMFVDGEPAMQWIAARFNGEPSTPNCGVLRLGCGRAHRDRGTRRRGQAHAHRRLRRAVHRRAPLGDHAGVPARPVRHRGPGQQTLHGEHGDLAESVYAMAVLFALDRAGAVEQIAALTRAHDVVILDRYVASNAAYSAARLHQDADGEMVSWVGEFEYDRLGLPVPIARSCSTCRSNWPRSAPGAGPSRSPTGPATPTNATTRCSSAPAPSTPTGRPTLARTVAVVGPTCPTGSGGRPFGLSATRRACGSGVYPESVTPWSP